MGQTRRRCPFTACKYEEMKVKKYIMLLCLLMAAPTAMASGYVGDCPAWRTGPDGKLICNVDSNGNTTSNNNGSSPSNHWNTLTNPNNNNNNHNQGCGGFNQQDCGWPNGQPMSPWQYQQVKATGRDAVNILMNSDMLASGVTTDGWSRYTVRYTGNQYTSLKGVVFNCKVSPNGRNFECVNWLPPRPKHVQFGNGWEVIFELLNQYQQRKNQ